MPYKGIMLISREDLRFDFKDARFDLSREADRKLLAWVLNQFLYGEVTGIQCGYWLYRAPHLGAATFLAKQAGEELAHVRKILRILSLIGEKPGPAHPAVKFLSTGMMGASWGEHVTLEMALGEGLVLTVFYALVDTIDQPEIKKILESASIEEERHVVFGETETIKWLKEHPKDRSFLLAQAVLQAGAMKRLKGFVSRKLASGANAGHPVLARFPEFYDHAVRRFEDRVQRLGLSSAPISSMGALAKAALVLSIPFHKLRMKLTRRNRLLTATYLDDPALQSEHERFHGTSLQ